MWDGTVFCCPDVTNSHEFMIMHLGLVDDGTARMWVRVEFTPPDDSSQIEDLDQWTLSVDEETAPPWWEDKVEGVRTTLANKVRGMFIRDEKSILLGGCWILLDGSNVKTVVNSNIVQMLGSSQVGGMHGFSQVGKMLDSSQVGKMWDYSQVGKMSGSSKVGKMFNCSQVKEMNGSSQVKEMWTYSKVVQMYGSSKVGRMFNCSQAPREPLKDSRD